MGSIGLDARRGQTSREDEAGAARELAEQIGNPDASVCLVFASPRYDSDRLVAELTRELAPAPVVGCTTAGEIGSAGFGSGGVVGLSLASARLRVGFGFTADVSESAFGRGKLALDTAARDLGFQANAFDRSRHVALSIIDGRSGQEELFIAGAAAAAPAIRFVGGSASDDLDAEPAARVFYAGEAWSGAALLILLDTDHPFATIKSEHMVPADVAAGIDRVVVTASDPSSRLVHELNGRPARAVYEEIIGVHGVDIGTPLASLHPFGYYVDGQPYVRSVMKVEGNSLRFACAVEDGVVLRPMKPGNMIEATRSDLRAAANAVGEMKALIAFNCLGRYFEIESSGDRSAMSELLTSFPIVGFNTFGEQYGALHVNHTLTALAIGDDSPVSGAGNG